MIGTLSSLGGLAVVVTLELTCFVLNMFCTSIFLEHSLGLHKNKLYKDINKYELINLAGCVLVYAIGFVDLIMVVGTIGTSFFLLWQMSNVWPILPQLVHVNDDLVVTTGTTSLNTMLACGVVSRAL